MTEPIAFDAQSARHALPLLVAGQAQKEFFVNEAFARIDALLHPAIEGEAIEPPAAPQPGECWLVAAPATGSWAQHEEELASWDGTQWTFCAPHDGMMLFDGATGARIVFRSGWQRITRPAAPTGGAVVDSEARAAITLMRDMLATLGLFPPA
ncbi:DUF2793 domain-containing protein [Qipengyuania sp.]|uniref:DUF2793 domain-containing protein n=1 Tax=Qipengyuania sp. TaxID=2004515 RepID=UPI0035188A65